MSDSGWFRHNSNAARTRQNRALIAVHSMTGYGRLWTLLEVLRETDDYRLPLDDLTFEMFAGDWQTTPDDAAAFISELVTRFRILETDGENVWSAALLADMGRYDEIREKRRRAGRIGGSVSRQEQETSKCLPIAKQELSQTDRQDKHTDIHTNSLSTNFRSWLKAYAEKSKSITNPDAFVQSYLDESLHPKIREELTDKYAEFLATQPPKIANGRIE